MAKYAVVTIPGDGIGKIVLPEALRVLDAAGFDAEYIHADVGWDFWVRDGNPLPGATIDLLARHGLGLFGAITSKPKAEAEAELRPELRDRGHTYFSPILTLRQRFGLDVCVRPCRSFPGNPLNFVRRARDGGIEEPAVDTVIFRQNTEGIYAGVSWTAPPDAVVLALETHPRFRPFSQVARGDLALETRIVTRPACRRILTAAFAYARKHGYRSVTVCEKPNVLRETSGMMEEEARKVHAEFADIQLWSTNIDAQMMWLTKNPEDYGVIVAGNMFGDIISDAFAGLVGGMGFAASGNIGPEVAIFEPSHGSAPRHATLEPSIVNPIAMILAGAMLMDHAGESQRAIAVRDAIATVLRQGDVRTYDMLKIPAGPDSIERGAATTAQMTEAIIDAL